MVKINDPIRQLYKDAVICHLIRKGLTEKQANKEMEKIF